MAESPAADACTRSSPSWTGIWAYAPRWPAACGSGCFQKGGGGGWMHAPAEVAERRQQRHIAGGQAERPRGVGEGEGREARELRKDEEAVVAVQHLQAGGCVDAVQARHARMHAAQAHRRMRACVLHAVVHACTRAHTWARSMQSRCCHTMLPKNCLVACRTIGRHACGTVALRWLQVAESLWTVPTMVVSASEVRPVSGAS